MQIAIPTEAQKEAGNFRMGHITVHGLPITIETPKGRRRRPEWPPMACHYGYIKGTIGADGENIDVFLGPEEDSELAIIIDQTDRHGKWDEAKVVLGYRTKDSAIAAYLKCYPSNWKLGNVSVLTIYQLKAFLKHGDLNKQSSQQISRYEAGETRLAVHTGVSDLATNERQMLQPEGSAVSTLRRARDNNIERVANQLQDVYRGYGQEASRRPAMVNRTDRQQRPLLKAELQMGHDRYASQEQAKQSPVYIQRKVADTGRLVKGVGCISDSTKEQGAGLWLDDRKGVNDSCRIAKEKLANANSQWGNVTNVGNGKAARNESSQSGHSAEDGNGTERSAYSAYEVLADLHLPYDAPIVDRYEWVESAHPRHEAGAPGSVGGQFKGDGQSGSGASSQLGEDGYAKDAPEWAKRFLEQKKAASQPQAQPAPKQFKPTTRIREVAAPPSIYRGHPLHWTSAPGNWGMKLVEWSSEINREMRELGMDIAAGQASRDQREKVWEQVWQSADKTKLRQLIGQMNEMDKAARAEGVRLSDYVNASGLLPSALRERMSSGSRFFDPERIRDKLKAANKMPGVRDKQKAEQERIQGYLEKKMGFTDVERGIKKPEPEAAPAPPAMQPSTPESLTAAVKSAFDSLTRDKQAKVDQAIRTGLSDDGEDLPSDTVADLRETVLEAWKQATQQAQEHNDALRQVMTNFGKNWGLVSARLAKGADYDKIKGFDQMAEYAAAHYPQLLGGHRGESDSGSTEESLAKVLREGLRSVPNPWDESIIDSVKSRIGPALAAAKQPYPEFDESVPFSIRGLAEKIRYQLELAMRETYKPVLIEYYNEKKKESDLGAGKWVTIGSEQGEDGGKHGGHPVFIGGDGKIKAGMGGKFEGKTMKEAFGKGENKPPEKPPEAKEPEKKPSGTPKEFSSHLGGGMSKQLAAGMGYKVGERFEHKGQMYEVTSVEKPYYHSRKSAEEMEDFGHFGVEPGWHQDYKAKPVERNAAELKRDADKKAAADASKAKADAGMKRFDEAKEGLKHSYDWPAGVPEPKWEEVHNTIDGKFGRGNRYYVGEVDGKKVAKSTMNQYDDFRESFYYPESIKENDEARKAESKKRLAATLNDVARNRRYEKDESKKEALAKEHEKLAVQYFEDHGELPYQLSLTPEMTKRAIYVGLQTPGLIDEAVRQEGMHGAFAIVLKQASAEEKAALNRYVATGKGEDAAESVRRKAKKLNDERAARVHELGKDLEPERLQNALRSVRDYAHYTPESAVEGEMEEQEQEAKNKAAKQAEREAKRQVTKSPAKSSGRAPSASWAKLKSGAWGARVDGSVNKGDSITITARDGRKQTKTVGKVVHDGGSYTLVEVYAASASEERDIQRYAAAQASVFVPTWLPNESSIF